ncbi:MAG: GlsB/YeaQ/YmgE family stress response membrane protein [Anaerolineae bacterium]
MFNLIAWIILGGFVGWLASAVMGRRKEQGCLMDVVVGVAGAFIGGAVISFIRGNGLQLSGDLNLDAGSLFTAFVGAVILLAVVRAVR